MVPQQQPAQLIPAVSTATDPLKTAAAGQPGSSPADGLLPPPGLMTQPPPHMMTGFQVRITFHKILWFMVYGNGMVGFNFKAM